MTKKDKQKAQVEKFLMSRGYTFEQLTEKQRNIVSNFLRSRRGMWFGISMIAFSAILLALTTFYGVYSVNKGTEFIKSNDIIFYAVVAERYDRIIEPAQAEKMASQVVETATTNGVRLAASIFLFGILVTAIMYHRDRKKTIDAFLPDNSTQNPCKNYSDVTE